MTEAEWFASERPDKDAGGIDPVSTGRSSYAAAAGCGYVAVLASGVYGPSSPTSADRRGYRGG